MVPKRALSLAFMAVFMSSVMVSFRVMLFSSAQCKKLVKAKDPDEL
jgi:hypothetical protein